MTGTDGVVKEPQDHLREINEELYKRNFELAIKNKTLSLLQELYQISILALDPKSLAGRVSSVIQKTLNTALVGVFTLDRDAKKFQLQGVAVSEILQQVLEKHQGILVGSEVSTGNVFDDGIMDNFTDAIHHRDQDFAMLIGSMIPEPQAIAIQSESGMSASFVYPLVAENKITGLLWFCLDRPYDTLSQFEQEAIHSLVNVVALALDRSFLYQQIQLANNTLAEANEKLKELDASKNEFLSFATHQLRSPLTAIKWGLDATMDVLKTRQASDEELKTVAHLRTTADDMVSTVNDLLDISKIEQGGLVMKTEVFDAIEFMDQISEEFRITAQKKGLAFTFEPHAPTASINADRTKLRQVVVNLIDNAIKYTPTGNIRVTLDADPATKQVTFTVADTGPGIAPEELAKLFVKFIRGAAGKSSQGGSGLGLYLAKKIVELHNGTIAAYSDGIGKGSRFVVVLPMV